MQYCAMNGPLKKKEIQKHLMYKIEEGSDLW